MQIEHYFWRKLLQFEKMVKFLPKTCHWQLFCTLWRMALFFDSRLQDLEKEHNGQSKDNIVNKGKSENLR